MITDCAHIKWNERSNGRFSCSNFKKERRGALEWMGLQKEKYEQVNRIIMNIIILV